MQPVGLLAPTQTQLPLTQLLPLLQFIGQVDATQAPIVHMKPCAHGPEVHMPQCSGPLERSKQPPLDVPAGQHD